MKSRYENMKPRVIFLRKKGKSYGEIQKILQLDISKSTLSNWCEAFPLSRIQQERMKGLMRKGAQRGRATALTVNRARREKYLQAIKKRNLHLATLLNNKDVAKIALTMLYLGEGGKNRKGAVFFGNSDPLIITLFLQLLRYCYDIDESKFRCTLQCRADQNISKLEKFWSRVTGISLAQFYKAKVDPRTIGKPSKKLDYKGVCRIDYFSAEIFWELMIIPKIL